MRVLLAFCACSLEISDKLLNELVNASAQRLNRSGIGGRSEGRAGPRDRWSGVLGLGRGFREKRKARPSRDWLREVVGAALDDKKRGDEASTIELASAIQSGNTRGWLHPTKRYQCFFAGQPS